MGFRSGTWGRGLGGLGLGDYPLGFWWLGQGEFRDGAWGATWGRGGAWELPFWGTWDHLGYWGTWGSLFRVLVASGTLGLGVLGTTSRALGAT